jgi:tRNA uridine 5-carboxymethylaminomethyl modification enzyme
VRNTVLDLTRGAIKNGQLEQQISADALLKAGLNVKRDAGRMSLFEWLRFPTLGLGDLLALSDEVADWHSDLVAELEQDGRYAPYLARQEAEILDMAANERIKLPNELDYAAIAGLSNEMVERLGTAQPDTLAAAARVRGVTPAALAAILVHAKRAAMSGVKAA